MEQIVNDYKLDLLYLLYADDLQFVCAHHEVDKILNALFKISSRYKLIVNPKKCGIVNIRKHEYLEAVDLHDVPIVEEYRYLGVLIDQNGSVEPS